MVSFRTLPLLLPFLSLPFTTNARRLRDGRLHANMPPMSGVPKISYPHDIVADVNGTTLPSLNQTYHFDQLIDHNNPSLGTFKQRYWHTWEFYKPGGPIILTTPG